MHVVQKGFLEIYKIQDNEKPAIETTHDQRMKVFFCLVLFFVFLKSSLNWVIKMESLSRPNTINLL